MGWGWEPRVKPRPSDAQALWSVNWITNHFPGQCSGSVSFLFRSVPSHACAVLELLASFSNDGQVDCFQVFHYFMSGAAVDNLAPIFLGALLLV